MAFAWRDEGVAVVGRMEVGGTLVDMEPPDEEFAIHDSQDDLVVMGFEGTVHQQGVAFEDAQVLHRHAADMDGEGAVGMDYQMVDDVLQQSRWFPLGE